MEIICLDLEGVLVPEIWIAFSEKTGIPELRRTTRDEPDYAKLMKFRMDILREHGLGLKDIQDVIATIRPLDGAKEFLDSLRSLTQVVILSDTFSEFAKPLMKQLGYPTIFCNSLVIDEDGMIAGVRMRQENGKLKAVKALKSIGFRTFAAGDSYNDLAMIHEADGGCLFRAPERILEEEKDLRLCTEYDAFLSEIKAFIAEG
ncbi:MAG: bifunctional phosphoserine phosphatase/homoserine phosphotransferase ThrH [Candidatus Ornithospirochaeta sp.]|nr:bifunctional phosphoserine phosphatase/homoserine phosphotransferase ThrH [Candidatus Ornithospirochaeta sp.]